MNNTKIMEMLIQLEKDADAIVSEIDQREYTIDYAEEVLASINEGLSSLNYAKEDLEKILDILRGNG